MHHWLQRCSAGPLWRQLRRSADNSRLCSFSFHPASSLFVFPKLLKGHPRCDES